MIEVVKTLLNPRCWIRNHFTNKAWDEALNNLLDKHTVTYVGTHTIVIGGVEIWTRNWPYAFGGAHEKHDFLPSRTTARRLKKAVDEAIVRKILKENK